MSFKRRYIEDSVYDITKYNNLPGNKDLCLKKCFIQHHFKHI